MSDSNNSSASQNSSDSSAAQIVPNFISNFLGGSSGVSSGFGPLITPLPFSGSAQVAGLSLSMNAHAPGGGASSGCLSPQGVNPPGSGGILSNDSLSASGVGGSGNGRPCTPPPTLSLGLGAPFPHSPGLISDVNSFAMFPPSFPTTLVPFDAFLETAGATLTTLEAAKLAIRAYHLTIRGTEQFTSLTYHAF
jgi:hypothetical protein